jgi:alcohol dehydrogenase
MKAFILEKYGRKVALRHGEMADPDVREDDVLVEVHAAGVNLLDAKVRNGEFKLILPFQSTNEALAYVETGRAKGKVVIQMK